MASLLGAPDNDRLVDENTPSWQEYSAHKMLEAAQQRQGERLEIPPHKVQISSPLQRNFLYFLLAAGGLALGYAVPEWAPVLIYGAILVAFAIALGMIIRDGVFLHFEGQRLEADGEMINKHTHGPEAAESRERGGLLRSFGRKKQTIFRSRLMQVHYQNVLRTFEQGARRAWVYQDASISEIQTMLSQRGMKLVWTIIEVLPQLGLLGTLIGLLTMFMAFRQDAATPQLSIIAGFGTALGTTILANLFVLMLRPLFMQNERTMNEILTTLQTLMAIFILPTQQYAMERSFSRSGQAAAQTLLPAVSPPPPPPPPAVEPRLTHTLEELAGTMREYLRHQEQVGGGSLARETAQIAQDVQQALRMFQETVDPKQLREQQQAAAQLSEAVQGLSKQLANMERAGGGKESPAPNERIEHDLTQLRVLTHDTLVLLEEIANRLPRAGAGGEMLSRQRSVQNQVFAETAELEEGPRAPERSGVSAPRIRLARERR